jgi:opacity protein-like surface antigen
MKRVLSVLVIMGLLSFAVNAFAADKIPADNNDFNHRQGFGVHFGNVSGNGYAWRYIGEPLGIQLVVGGLTAGDNHHNLNDGIYVYDSPYLNNIVRSANGRKYNFNVGANLILPLRQSSGAMFYLHGGVNWKYSDQQKYSREYEYDTSIDENYNYHAITDVSTSHKVKSYYNIGVGPGVELQAGKYFKLVLELPITYTGDEEFIMYIPQAGLYYYFK